MSSILQVVACLANSLFSPIIAPSGAPLGYPPLRENKDYKDFGIDSNIPTALSLICTKAFPNYGLVEEALDEGLRDVLELGLKLLAESTLLVDSGEELRLVGLEMSEVIGLPLQNALDGDIIEVTVDTGEDERNHLVDGHRGVLLLLEELGETLTTVQDLLGSGIQIGTKLGECGDLTVLGQVELQGTGDLLHGLELGSGTDTGDRKTDVDSRTDTLVEKLGLQEDLAVGNGNDVGGNVSRDITTLGLNDGQSSHGAATVLVVELSSTLEQTRVQVENVTRVSLTARRTTEQQRHLTVSNSLLRQIIIDHKRVLSRVSEVLSHGCLKK